jgi:hypothetical protein
MRAFMTVPGFRVADGRVVAPGSALAEARAILAESEPAPTCVMLRTSYETLSAHAYESRFPQDFGEMSLALAEAIRRALDSGVFDNA